MPRVSTTAPTLKSRRNAALQFRPKNREECVEFTPLLRLFGSRSAHLWRGTDTTQQASPTKLQLREKVVDAFPIPGATVAEVDYREGRGITPVRMRRYAAHDWRSDATNLLIISPTGGGKTYLACALAIGACQSEHSVLYFRMDDLARRLVIARGDGIAHQKLLNELSNIDLLIIDLCR